MAARHVLVVGAGLNGTATAWQLARRGVQVTLLERDIPAGTQGSSHGSSRIFRYAYTDPLYADLVRRARADWTDLEEVSGVPLLTAHGAVDHGSGRDAAQLSALLGSLGVRNEVLSAEAARERWPHMVFQTPVLFHPDAGALNARLAAETMASLAAASGADVRTGAEAVAVRRTERGFAVDVVTGSSSALEETLYPTDVVVAAGGFLPRLLPTLPLPAEFVRRLPPFRVRKEQIFHFRWRDPDAAWPTFIHKEPGMQTYGLPGGADADFAGIKVAEFDGGPLISSAADPDRSIDPDNRARVTAYVREFLPGLDPTPYAEAACLFTPTPTEDFVIDTADHLTLQAACSGHAAKFAPLLGRLTAAQVLGDEPVPARFRPCSA
ncbi:FAD-dependent oxidoreductase [Actinocorallia sp. A-T 12471]|uniref:FAD-dependent oxidoreductase n=1 Tax=Actinocorallia sp. A-T 12471 TaxID=3089813 RepID=UPI0029D37AA7|nr:FAD-dependent oxidoreductase [Actinocorallia sp. A-T 12471]MDX6742312.1 FAD-dependent oxidoreductase [Actinocorallia sp. A-T 12471]